MVAQGKDKLLPLRENLARSCLPLPKIYGFSFQPATTPQFQTMGGSRAGAEGEPINPVSLRSSVRPLTTHLYTPLFQESCNNSLCLL